MKKNYYVPKPKTVAICKICEVAFNTRKNFIQELCIKCRLAKFQKSYYEKRRQDPNWNHNRYLKSKGKNTKVQKLYEAKKALERLLDRVEIKRQQIRELEEVKNG
ncbi:MAG: hypothetical protein ACD_19C00140G0003 [uncultured bacterium]|nr:MAG: hypothetical protein ACD_19C00140G0003 [uncultured bacterium]